MYLCEESIDNRQWCADISEEFLLFNSAGVFYDMEDNLTQWDLMVHYMCQLLSYKDGGTSLYASQLEQYHRAECLQNGRASYYLAGLHNGVLDTPSLAQSFCCQLPQGGLENLSYKEFDTMVGECMAVLVALELIVLGDGNA